MVALQIQHKTTYRFRGLVSLAPLRLMLRPRESRDLRLASQNLTITPVAVPAWAHDVFGNAVAVATFTAMTDMLIIDSVANISLETADWPVFAIAASAISYPFSYSTDEWTDLGALTIAQYPDPAERLQNWARGFIRSSPTDTLSLLKDLNAGIAQRIQYQSREVEGTQSPNETLDRGWGARAATSRCCSRKQHASSASVRAWCRVICTIRTTTGWARPKRARPTPGPRSLSPERAGSPSTRPTAASEAAI